MSENFKLSFNFQEMQQILFNLILSKQHILSGWIPNFEKELTNQKQRIQIFTPQNVWVHSSFFQDIFENLDKGGAILMETKSSQTCLLVEETYFLNCTSADSGGCIYQSPGNLIVHSCCFSLYGYELFYPRGTCLYSISTNTFDNFQEIEYCSINSHVNAPFAHIDEGTTYLSNGCISINSLNLSQELYLHAMNLLTISPYDQFSYNSLQYCSFVNNTNRENVPIDRLLLFQNNVNCYMCNILRNYAYYLLYINGQFKIWNSCILENECNLVVYLATTSSYAYFYNCTTQDPEVNSPTRFHTYNIPSSSFLHALDHLQTGYCVAEYDYLDNLKPYIPEDENDEKVLTLSKKHIKKSVFF